MKRILQIVLLILLVGSLPQSAAAQWGRYAPYSSSRYWTRQGVYSQSPYYRYTRPYYPRYWQGPFYPGPHW